MGDVVLTQTGGGGFGDPWERDPALVCADVLDGYVSRTAAAEAYGVVLPDELAVDTQQTTA